MATIDRIPEQNLHPEGMTPNQERLLDLMFTRAIHVRSQMGRDTSEGREFYEETYGSAFSVAKPGTGFIFKHHETHPEAPPAPFKINLRNLKPETLEQVGAVLKDLRRETGLTDRLCVGIPEAGAPLAEAFARAAKILVKPNILGKAKRADGTRTIVANRDSGLRGKVIMVDDVVTHGDTKIEAFTKAKNAGVDISGLLLVVDREQGGLEFLRKEGYKVWAAFTATQALAYGLRKGFIDKEQYDRSVAYIKENKVSQE